MSRGVTQNKAAGLANIGAAIAYLKQNGATKIGVIGWCMGGRWSLFTALEYHEDIAASIIYYGGVTDDKDELAVLDMPVLGIFAGKDFIVQPKKAYRFAVSMEELKKDLEFYMYHDADHAFANPSGTEYNAEAAADAGLTLLGYTSQAQFLLASGLDELYAQARDTQEQLQYAQQIKRLTLPAEMGERFQVMALGKNYQQSLRGFALRDYRFRL